MIFFTDKHRVAVEIDIEDYELVSRYVWHVDNHGYPGTYVGTGTTHRRVQLHMFLLGPAPAGLIWDHHDRDRLNNRRENLRAVTETVNNRNRATSCLNTSGYPGVEQRRGKKWRAYLRVDGKQQYFGTYETRDEAIQARKAAEDLYWGANR